MNVSAAGMTTLCPNWEFADAMTGVFYDDDRSRKQVCARLCQHSCQALNYALAARVMEPEEDDADNLSCRRGDDFTEVQVERENDALLDKGLLEDLAVRQP